MNVTCSESSQLLRLIILSDPTRGIINMFRFGVEELDKVGEKARKERSRQINACVSYQFITHLHRRDAWNAKLVIYILF